MSFAVFGVIIAFSVHYIGSLGVRSGPPKDRTNVSMQVPDVNGLVVDSNVLLRGVPVGKVTAIDTSVQTAIIHFYIDERYSVPVDSEVRLENLSALGESYVGLVPRSTHGPSFHNGQQVATEDVVLPASISELATNVVRILNQMDPAQITQLVDEVGRSIPGDESVLPRLTRASTLLRDAVRGMNGDGGDVLADFQTLLQNAGFVGPSLAAIGPDLRATAPALYGLYWAANDVVTQTGAPESIRNVGRLLARIQAFLDNRAPDLKVFGEALAPNIKGVAASAMNFDTSQILSNMLDAIPEDGTITLRVKAPNP
ncbi:hypothetical protein MKOR_30540 [Mycolicibacillus koreensis]|nr:hypothetical protein MKOR_30540 [Mycolicibacillus koreensis]